MSISDLWNNSYVNRAVQCRECCHIHTSAIQLYRLSSRLRKYIAIHFNPHRGSGGRTVERLHLPDIDQEERWHM